MLGKLPVASFCIATLEEVVVSRWPQHASQDGKGAAGGTFSNRMPSGARVPLHPEPQQYITRNCSTMRGGNIGVKLTHA